MRRVVTGRKDGKSVVLEDKEIALQGSLDYLSAGLWKTEGIPTVPLQEKDIQQFAALQFPKPGETTISMYVIPPDKEYFKKAKTVGVDLEGNWRKIFGDDYGMHKTDTVDYGIVLSGEMWMELDDHADVHLKAGDCVIQNGARHGWRNKGTQNCVMVFILIGANRK